jgi:flagellum-specific peptidoglycan hydrolase FlgJ
MKLHQILLLSLLTLINKPNTTPHNNQITKIQEISLFLDSINAKYKTIILKQIILESNNLSSNLVKSNNNLLGMKHPTQRLTLSTHKSNGFATYKNWKHSVIDHSIWILTYCKHCNSEQDLLNLLQKQYAKDPLYIQKLNKITIPQ